MELYHEYDYIVSCSLNSLLSRAGSLILEPGHELKPNGDLVRFLFRQNWINLVCVEPVTPQTCRKHSTIVIDTQSILAMLIWYFNFFKQTVEINHRPADERAKPIKTNIFVILAFLIFLTFLIVLSFFVVHLGQYITFPGTFHGGDS